MSEEIFDAMNNLNEFFDEEKAKDSTKDLLICECRSVCINQLVDFAAQHDHLELDSLRKEFGLGTGCGSCKNSYDHWKKIVLDRIKK